MQCPHCKQVRKQGIEPGTGAPAFYYSGTVKTLLGKELLYRKRTRRCTNWLCAKTFETKEMSIDDSNVIENKLQELYHFKARAKIFQSQYERETKKTKEFQQQVDSLKKIIMNLGETNKQNVKVVETASIEHGFPFKKDETSVENEEKDSDHLWE